MLVCCTDVIPSWSYDTFLIDFEDHTPKFRLFPWSNHPVDCQPLTQVRYSAKGEKVRNN